MTPPPISRHNLVFRQLDEIGRLRSILDRGAWANGDRLEVGEREIVRWHLELAREERDRIRRGPAR